MRTQSETLMYLLAGLLAVEHAAASTCMLLAASSDADCESLCDGCRCAGASWQVLEQHSHRTGQTSWFCASGGAGTEYTLVTPTGGAYRTLAAQQSCEVDVVSEMCSGGLDGAGRLALANKVFAKSTIATDTTFYSVGCGTGGVSGEAGFYIVYGSATGVSGGASTDGGASHQLAIHFHPDDVAASTPVTAAWVLQGSDCNTGAGSQSRCTFNNWVPTNGPGFNGGYGGYHADCPTGWTCIQGSPINYGDAPSYAHPALGNAAYTNAALDTTTTLLTWSGSDYGHGEPSTCDLCGGACACSSEIPTTLVSLWFTTLTYRRC